MLYKVNENIREINEFNDNYNELQRKDTNLISFIKMSMIFNTGYQG